MQAKNKEIPQRQGEKTLDRNTHFGGETAASVFSSSSETPPFMLDPLSGGANDRPTNTRPIDGGSYRPQIVAAGACLRSGERRYDTFCLADI